MGIELIKGRKVKEIICGCGADKEGIIETDTTEEEEKEYGCCFPQCDVIDYERCHDACCVIAYECRACHMRWVFALQAPIHRD